MRLYRDLTPGETLQAGDERMCVVSMQWSPIAETGVGWQVVDSSPLYRRPVNLPMLQPVTPEAMAELEGRDAWVILFRHRESYYSRYQRAIYFPLERGWFGSDGNQINPLDWYWYIEPSTIPEVTE